nr:MAG TPA: HypF [Caudoviricetes sp.]
MFRLPSSNFQINLLLAFLPCPSRLYSPILYDNTPNNNESLPKFLNTAHFFRRSSLSKESAFCSEIFELNVSPGINRCPYPIYKCEECHPSYSFIRTTASSNKSFSMIVVNDWGGLVDALPLKSRKQQPVINALINVYFFNNSLMSARISFMSDRMDVNCVIVASKTALSNLMASIFSYWSSILISSVEHRLVNSLILAILVRCCIYIVIMKDSMILNVLKFSKMKSLNPVMGY